MPVVRALWASPALVPSLAVFPSLSGHGTEAANDVKRVLMLQEGYQKSKNKSSGAARKGEATAQESGGVRLQSSKNAKGYRVMGRQARGRVWART